MLNGRARQYDARNGRFLSQDSIGFAGGDENLYRYVGNNPVNLTDPTGTIAVKLILGAVIAVVLSDNVFQPGDQRLDELQNTDFDGRPPESVPPNDRTRPNIGPFDKIPGRETKGPRQASLGLNQSNLGNSFLENGIIQGSSSAACKN